MNIEFTDNSDEVLSAMREAAARALEKCGLVAEGYAKKLCGGFKHTTGNLRGSISHSVDEGKMEAYVGTNSEYAPYVELGTGKYYPGGRPGWWVYVDGESTKKGPKNMRTYTYDEAKQIMAILRSKGLDAHMTEGREANPFIKPAVADHAQTYRNIIEDELKG